MLRKKIFGRNIKRFGRDLRYITTGPPCKSDVVQWLRTPAVDGIWIDKLGKSGAVDGREYVPTRVFEGDGTRYVDLDNEINLGTSHAVEFEAILTNNPEFILNGATGNSLLTTGGGSTLFYRANNADAVFNVVIDGLKHKYTIVRENLDVKLYIDDDVIPQTITLSSNENFAIESISNSSSGFTERLNYINLNGYHFDFTDYPTTQPNTTLVGFNKTTGAMITGEVQSSTGADTVVDLTLDEGAMNELGYVVSKAQGKNLFDKSELFSPSYDQYGSLSAVRKGYWSLIESIDELTLASSGSTHIAYFGEDKTYLDGETLDTVGTGTTGTKLLTIPSNAIYCVVSGLDNGGALDTDFDIVQLEQGTTPTAYEAYEGLHYKDDGASPIPQGNRIYVAENGTCACYLANGTQPKYSDVGGFVGLLKADKEYNVGGFTANGSDNYLDTGIVPNQDTSMCLWIRYSVLPSVNETQGVLDGGGRFYIGAISGNWFIGWGNSANSGVPVDTLPHKIEIKNSKLYLDDLEIASTPDTISTIVNTIHLTGLNAGTDEYSTNLIYKAEIIHNGQTHIWDFNADLDKTVKYTIDGVLQASPTIQGTVTSGQWQATGYTRDLTQLKALRDADALTTVQSFDGSGNPLVVAVADRPNIDNPRFTTEEEELLYSEEMAEPCYTKILKHLDLVNALYDIDGEQLFDIDGSPLYALNDGVTI